MRPFTLLLVLGILNVHCKEEAAETGEQKVQVIKDCTGDYLRSAAGDLLICNSDAVAAFRNGDFVKARFNQVARCPEKSQLNCELLHENKGLIEVKEIRKISTGN
ncbi:hypothetical protein [Pedobacter sp. SYSU D00535]|uniref:hypothetical protein n=1 Tax=Pedobacter sp. SYSU D00535 TaxID=2810308 RepID=UPI001A9769EC|nr:hypothetical protein [Pedobacter sp. SYSU D00535]